MVQTLQAGQVTLRDLIEEFQVQLVQDQQFFPEWQENLSELTDFEKQFLDKIKAGYFNLITDPPVLEKPLVMECSPMAVVLYLSRWLSSSPISMLRRICLASSINSTASIKYSEF